MTRETNHERFARVFAASRGSEFTTSQIRTMLQGIVASGAILPNDHALGNKGACWCAGTDKRIFDRIGFGLYRVR